MKDETWDSFITDTCAAQAESRRKLSGRWVVLPGLGIGHTHKRGRERAEEKRG